MEIVIFTGLQAAGKSTFYRTHFATTHEQVSKDLLRTKREPGLWQVRLIEAALGEGRSVVVDNTNVTVADRALLIAQGRRHGATIVGYSFASSMPECLARNSQREGRACVPDIALYITAAKLVPPSYAEGFDVLYDVQIAGLALFAIARMPMSPGAGRGDDHELARLPGATMALPLLR